MMEPSSQFSQTECQICFNPFSTRRRPKLLGCQHTCCSICLGQMMLNHKDICCPWCRQITHLSGLSVLQLPDDPKVLSTVAVVRPPVFIRLPNSSCYLLPLTTDQHTFHYSFKTTGDAAQPEQAAGESEEEEERDVVMKGSACTGFCTVLLVAVILLFLLAIVLHNMSCVSKRFSIISCG